MEAFPEDYVAHNLPLLVLSGIGQDEDGPSTSSDNSTKLLQEGGFRIRTNTPPLTGRTSLSLLRAFLAFDGTDASKTRKLLREKDSLGPFKIRRVGRVG